MKSPSTKILDEWAKWAKFEFWGEPHQRQQLEAMLVAIARLVGAMKRGEEPRWLSLLGSSGGGKTYLARRAWHWFSTGPLFRTSMVDAIETGRTEACYPGQWCYWPHVAAELLGNRGYDWLKELGQEKFVVLDEIGANRDPSGHVRDCLAQVLCCRVGKWTIVTANSTLENIEKNLDPRVASRMIRDGNTVVELDLPDYWVWKKAQEQK